MRKLFFIICMLAGYCLAAQETIVIDIPVKPVSIVDPATYDPNWLSSQFEVVNEGGVYYFKVAVDGWNNSISVNWVTFPASATHFRFYARVEQGTSDIPIDQTYTFLKLADTNWSIIGEGNGLSSPELKEYSIPVSNVAPVCVLQAAIQNPDNDWQGIQGAVLYISKVEALSENSQTEFHAGDLTTLRNIRDNSTAPWGDPLSVLWPDNVNPLEWKGVTWSNTQPYRVTGLNLQSKGITQTDYTGFSELQVLYCSGNQLPEINVSGLTNLQQLEAGGNMLTNIDLSGLSSLTSLSLYYNQLSSISLTGLEKLQYMNLDGNQLTEIEVSQMDKLFQFYIGYNQLTELDITGLTSLKYFNCSGNRLRELPIPAELTLDQADLSANNFPFSRLIPRANVPGWYNYSPQKTIFEDYTYVQDSPIDYSSESMVNGIETIFKWFKNNVAIEGATGPTYTPVEDGYYHCEMTNATFDGLVLKTKSIKVGNPPEFDAGDLATLKTIRANASTDVWEPLATIWADEVPPENWQGVTWSENPPRRVERLYISSKGITNLDVTGLGKLMELICDNNQIIDLQVSGLANLYTLSAGSNQLTSIDLTGLPNLQSLFLYVNQLDYINLAGLSLLQDINMENNKLTGINLNGLDKLYGLYIGYNLLTDIDLTGLTNLRYLYINDNKLKNLTFPSDLQLYGSYIRNNNLPFSKLLLPENVRHFYEYSPQYRLFEKQEIDLGTSIEYPLEQSVNGVETLFTWFRDGVEIPDAGHSYTYTPTVDGFYHCTMTNAVFPGLELTTNKVKAGDPYVEFDPADLAALLKIRDNMKPWSWLRQQWADEDMTGSWHNVVWTEIETGKPKRVTLLRIGGENLGLLDVSPLTELRHLDCGGNQLKTLDLTGLVKLQYLYCPYNELSILDITDLDALVNLEAYRNDLTSFQVPNLTSLSWINLAENRIPFSEMTLSGTNYYIHYNPQRDIYMDYPYVDGEPVSYPEEVFVHGNQTYFNWYKNNELISANDLSGSYMPDGDGFYYCTMTNNAFPGIVLRTEPVKIGNPPEYDPYDVSVLIAIRDAAPAGSRLKTDWADPENVRNWPHLVWDFYPKKLIVIDVTNAKLTSLVISGLSKLQQLYCFENQIISLTLANLPELNYLNAHTNQISELQMKDLPNLNTLAFGGNMLTELDVTGFPYIFHLSIDNNRLKKLKGLESLAGSAELKFQGNFLPFSQMPVRTNQWTYEYIPQGKIFAEVTIPVFTQIDYSSEALIDGTETTFKWYFDGDLIAGTDNSGIYIPTQPGQYHCEMTNDKFPHLTLTTHALNVISIPPEVVCNDLEVLPGLDGTYTLTAADLSKGIECTTGLADAIEELTVVVTPDIFSAWTDESPVAVEVEVTNSYNLSATCQADITLLKRQTVLVNTGQTTVQYSDNITLEVLLTDDLTSAPLAMKTVTFSIEGQHITANTDSEGIAAVLFNAGMSPGTWEAIVSFAGDALFTAAQTRISFAVLQENALLYYNGTEIAATVSATNLTANIDLRTAITDISDGSRGDITNAKVKFVNMTGGTSVDISEWLDVEALTDPYTGIVSYPWKVTLPKNQPAETYTIAVVADGYYTAREEFVLTVYVPSGEFITGGGHVIPDGSAGLYASDEETKTRFGFNVRFNKKGTALQGKLNFIFTSGGKTYQVTSNATESLGVNTDDPTNRWAQFVAKCTMVDITDPGRPVSISGNLTMQISMAENGEADLNDRIAFTLWSGNILFYSSSWNGVKTSMLPIANGKIVISSSSSAGGRKSAEFAASEDGGNGQMMNVYPNPFSDRVFFDIRLEESAPVTIEIYSVTGAKVSTLFEGYLEAGQQTRFEFVPGNIPSQVLIYKVQTGSEFATGRLVFRK